MPTPSVLYISYDGMLEPLGQSQVIAYLERLTDTAHFHILSFEKPADLADTQRRTALTERLTAAGIAWHPLTYHKTPTVPATLFDIAQGLVVALWLTLRHRVRIVHAFDMRGLWADERTDGGIWPVGGRVYRAVKRLEKTLLLGADHIVTLTHASRAVIEGFPYMGDRRHAPLSVIPTCADLDRFTPGTTARPQPYTLGYLGSIGTWYMFDEVLACFKLLREAKPDARLLVVNRNEQALVSEMATRAGIPADAIEITGADHSEVPGMIRRMSAGAAIIRPVFSKIASAPTKLAEYLGCGVPCLGNVGVGDMELILEKEAAGVALHDFNDAERKRAVAALLALEEDATTAERCRAVSLRHFSVDEGAASYRAIYRELTV